MPELNEEQGKYLFSLSAVDIVPQVEGDKKRTFKGTAYGGGRVDGHWFWGRNGVVFDLEGIEIPTPTPLLEEHFSTSRVGVVKEVGINQNITVTGDFLRNAKAREVVDDADDGYPFQMSMFIDPGSVEEVGQGVSVVVNGQTFTGPVAVFRNNRIREFTICSTGADRTTSVNAFSAKPGTTNQPTEDTDVTELEKAQAAQKQAEQERDDALADLKKFKADKREGDIKALETALNKQFSAEEKTSYTNMDDTSFAFMSQQLTQFSAGNQPPAGQQQQQQVPSHLAHLFSHQATGGQGGQGQGGNQGAGDKHKFTAGAQAFAEQKGK
ncbi:MULTISPECIES: hypothetical protein [Acinetobacter]|jgi:hypothetical protein|uniref:DUF2213 domain-containing protein n=1 Tax=Acinetobacter johnsonii TaxID=40214 RepID=A0AAW6RSL4_ACIJO|nr:hypothetical protein [Acinetobacter johnsonii]MDG9787360.1 hypothetical protein [Acinetobacter johnsonii]MDG9798445.1 hypothetical protein [Acinetobacter johnsonii]